MQKIKLLEGKKKWLKYKFLAFLYAFFPDFCIIGYFIWLFTINFVFAYLLIYVSKNDNFFFNLYAFTPFSTNSVSSYSMFFFMKKKSPLFCKKKLNTFEKYKYLQYYSFNLNNRILFFYHLIFCFFFWLIVIYHYINLPSQY